MMKSEGYSAAFRRNKVIFGIVTVFAVLTLMLMLLYSVKVKEILVTDMDGAEKDAVVSLIFPEEEDLRMYRVLLKCIGKTGAEESFQSVSVSIKGINSCVIDAVPRPAAARLADENGTRPVDEKGYILPDKGEISLPLIEGADADGTAIFRPAGGSASDTLEYALRVVRLLNSAEIPFEKLQADDSGIIVCMGDVKAVFGNDLVTERKVQILKEQIPGFSGLKGTVHLENYDGSAEKEVFTFEVEP